MTGQLVTRVFCGLIALYVTGAGIATAQIEFVDTSFSTFTDSVTLQRLGVRRGGTRFIYRTEDLITGSITALNLPGNFSTSVLSADGYPATGAPHGFLNDPVLNRGLTTPGLGDGTFNPGDQFTEYTFDLPVVNGLDDDLLLSFITFDFGSFETQPGPYWLSADGGTPIQIDRAADFDLASVASIPRFAFTGPDLTDPTQLLSTNVQLVGGLGSASALPRPSLQLIDLDEFGIALGGTIQTLRIWDDDASNGNTIHPTFIAAFPQTQAVAVPETGAHWFLIGCVAAIAIASWRRSERTTLVARS